MAISNWHRMTMEEARNKDLITRSGINVKSSKIKVLLFISVIVLICSIIYLGISGGLNKILEGIASISTDDGIPLNRESVKAFLNYHPQMALYVSSILNIALCVIFLNAYPILWFGSKIASMISQSPYKRTDKGNKLTEYIYGLQNFIHDFSNLNDYDKEGLVLWDKYLIYAVILEENTKIIDEIKEYKIKIKTTI